jgi:hypothetical protein
MRIDPARQPATMLIDGRVRRVEAADQVNPIYSRVGIRSGTKIRATLVGYEPRVSTADVSDTYRSRHQPANQVSVDLRSDSSHEPDGH